MRCDEFNERFHQTLDRRLPLSSDPALVSHAAGCTACRAQMQAWDALETALSDEDRPAPPADLAARVVAELAPPNQRRSWNAATAAWIGTALALAATLLIGLTVYLTSDHNPQPIASSSATTDDNSAPSQNQPPTLALGRPQAASGSNEALPRENLPAESLASSGQQSDETAYPTWVERFSQESMQSPYLHQSTWVEPVSATVRPFTTSFQTAIDYPVPRPIATTFTTAFHAVRTSEPQETLPPGPQSSLPQPTDKPQAREIDLHVTAQLG